MIIIFNVTDPDGRNRRLSAVCGPSTTAAGAVNIFRTRMGVPNAVKVEVQLENHIPIRHQTAPLTSLRKQRGGVAQVLQIPLWVLLSGPEDMVRAVDYSKLESLEEEEEEDDTCARGGAANGARNGVGAADDESALLEEMGPGWTARGERPVERIMKGRYDGAGRDEPPMPQTARRAAAVSVRIALPAPLTARGPSRRAGAPFNSSVVPPPTPGGRNSQDGAHLERITKAKPSLSREVSPATTSGTPTPIPAAAAAAAQPATQRKHVAPEALANSAASATPAKPKEPSTAAERGHTARRDSKMAQIMLREYPKLLDPSGTREIVEVVRGDERLSVKSYNPDLQVPSEIDTVSAVDFSRYLSVGLVHGIELRAANLGHKIALYGALNSLKHSCRPNTAVHLDFHTDPQSATCRCAVVDGLRKGDEMTYLYRHADSQAFLLLSRERRQNLLRRRYFFECDCARCLHSAAVQGKTPAAVGAGEPPTCSPPIPNASLDAEATLTGCFFTNSTYDKDEAKQDAISTTMKEDFDALQIMSDDGLEITLTIAGNVPPAVRAKQCNHLLQFMRKYGSAESTLRLHEHHWRLNMVRAAYIQETVRLCAIKGVTPEARRRDPESKTLFTPTRTVFDWCLKQLAVESLFIPAGHPHRLTTYESFLFLVSILPPSLAASVMRQARTASRVNWEELQATKEAWGLLKRTNVPPSVVRANEQQRGAYSGASVPSTPRPGVPQRTIVKKPTVPAAVEKKR